MIPAATDALNSARVEAAVRAQCQAGRPSGPG